MSHKTTKRFYTKVRGAVTFDAPFESTLVALHEGGDPKHTYQCDEYIQCANREAQRILKWLRKALPSATHYALVDLMKNEKSAGKRLVERLEKEKSK